jgi:hypothetical protein
LKKLNMDDEVGSGDAAREISRYNRGLMAL